MERKMNTDIGEDLETRRMDDIFHTVDAVTSQNPYRP